MTQPTDEGAPRRLAEEIFRIGERIGWNHVGQDDEFRLRDPLILLLAQAFAEVRAERDREWSARLWPEDQETWDDGAPEPCDAISATAHWENARAARDAEIVKALRREANTNFDVDTLAYDALLREALHIEESHGGPL